MKRWGPSRSYGVDVTFSDKWRRIFGAICPGILMRDLGL